MNRKLSTVSIFYQHAARHGLDLGELITCWNPGARQGGWKPFLHHISTVKADNSCHIRQAAERRHELTRSKAVAALRELQTQGGPATFEAVAAAAGVSRSWLYTQVDLRTVIIGLRDDHPRPPRASQSSARTESLRARLTGSLERNRELSTEIEHLRHQLALAWDTHGDGTPASAKRNLERTSPWSPSTSPPTSAFLP